MRGKRFLTYTEKRIGNLPHPNTFFDIHISSKLKKVFGHHGFASPIIFFCLFRDVLIK